MRYFCVLDDFRQVTAGFAIYSLWSLRCLVTQPTVYVYAMRPASIMNLRPVLAVKRFSFSANDKSKTKFVPRLNPFSPASRAAECSRLTFYDATTDFPTKHVWGTTAENRDDISLPRSRKCFWLVVLGGKIASTNRPFARRRQFTTTTRTLFVFPFIFNFGNPSEV